MSWKDRTVLRILMLVASFLSRDEWKKEVDSLAQQINLYAPKEAGDK